MGQAQGNGALWKQVVPGAREEALGLCGDSCDENACKAIEESRLRRSDKVYIWPDVESNEISCR